ncbi:carbohydrate ABC transporter permease [Microbispora sp. ATCC PTA-5024]|uniref:carbohydrate ABC transporter permease n=1 Tax=Microbispora sp. ATCC PTA-5024 TaxID=316330 RepID=UPI0018DCD62D|nr:sugar ABC transporter permease [Microbispora sp. ATCC PTA-5024]
MSTHTWLRSGRPSLGARTRHPQSNPHEVRARSVRTRWILGAPLLAFLVLLVAAPIAYGVWTSLTRRTLSGTDAPFAGLANYGAVLGDGAFWHSLGFTAAFTAAVVVLEVPLGFGLALLVNQRLPGHRVLFTALLLPIMVAPSLLGVMFRLLLNGDIGALPALLARFGVSVSLFDPSSVVPLLVVLDVLQWTPFTFLILYAGLQGVPADLYEAAAVDGASYVRTLRSVVAPVMGPVLASAAFLRAIDAFRTFDVVYVLTGGGPGTSTTTASIYIYKTAFTDGDFGIASAASVVLLLLLIGLVPVVVRRIVGKPGEGRR